MTGHAERVGDEAGAHVIIERPADDSSCRQVDDGGQVGPPFPGADVGDVAHVAPVELDSGPKVRRIMSTDWAWASGSAIVVARHRYLHRPASPARAISRATRFLPTWTSWSRSSLWILGAP